MANFGLRWQSERAWYGEIGLEMEKTNAHGMARLGLRWKSERAWYGEIGLGVRSLFAIGVLENERGKP